MNILVDELPVTVVIDRQEYAVNWGFRTFILIEICIFDMNLSDEDRIINALRLFYGDSIPQDITSAFNMMMWFYRGGKDDKKPSKGPARPAKEKRCYCFEQDAPHIYSAFRTQYGMDLQDIKNTDLHWWKFKSLFESLSEELKMSKIMYYRVAETAGMDKSQVKFIRQMKKIYALETETTADAKKSLAKRDADLKNYVKRKVNGGRK